MPRLFVPNRYFGQPQQNTGIDWGNPLTRGLHTIVNGPQKINAKTGKLGVTSGAGGYTSAPFKPGVARTFARANSAQEAYSVASFSGDITIFLVGGIVSTLASTQRVIDLLAGTTSRVRLGENGNNAMTFTTTPSGGSAVSAAGGGVGDHIYVGVLSGTTMTFYKDGVSVGTATQAANNWSDVDTFTVGSTAFAENSTSNVYLAGIVQRAWTSAEIRSFSDNPWQLLKAPQRLFLNTTGGNSLVVNPSGGFTLGGVSTIVRGEVKLPSGGMTLGGSASITEVNLQYYTYTPSGGYTLGGTGTALRSAVKTASGGIIFGGASTVVETPPPGGTGHHKKRTRRPRWYVP